MIKGRAQESRWGAKWWCLATCALLAITCGVLLTLLLQSQAALASKARQAKDLQTRATALSISQAVLNHSLSTASDLDFEAQQAANTVVRFILKTRTISEPVFHTCWEKAAQAERDGKILFPETQGVFQFCRTSLRNAPLQALLASTIALRTGAWTRCVRTHKVDWNNAFCETDPSYEMLKGATNTLLEFALDPQWLTKQPVGLAIAPTERFRGPDPAPPIHDPGKSAGSLTDYNQ